MTAQELRAAIAQADPALVAHSERTPAKGRRLPGVCLRVGLAAAILVGAMTVTAAASPAFREWLFGIQTLQEAPIARPVAFEGEDFGVFSEGKLEIRPKVDLADDAPAEIETFYVPMVLAESWQPGVVYAEDPEAYLDQLREGCCLYWDDPDAAPPRSVQFSQYTGQYLRLGTPMTWISLGYHREGAGYHIEATEVGGIPMQHVRVEPSTASLDHGSASSSGGDYYFWTDGSYVFSLGVPLGTEPGFVAEVVASLAPVEEIAPYLDFRPDEGPVLTDPPLTVRYTLPWLPEGWVQLDTSASQEPWLASFAWEKEGAGNTFLTMLQTSQEDFALAEAFTWSAGMEAFTKTTLDSAGAEATLYESETRIQLVIPLEDSVIALESFGPQKLTAEELLEIAARRTPAR